MRKPEQCLVQCFIHPVPVTGEWEILRKRQHFYLPHFYLPVFTMNNCKPESTKLLSG